MRFLSIKLNRQLYRQAAFVVAVAMCLLGVSRAEAQPSRSQFQVELQLREQVRIEGRVVTLGDLTVGIQADPQTAKALRELELFPAPTHARRYRADEIAERLALRGVDLTYCRFAGSTSVLIEPESGSEVATKLQDGQAATVAIPNDEELNQKANERIRELAVDMLRQRVFASGEWVVEVEMEPAAAVLIASPSNRLSISGLNQPWVGRHEVTVRVSDGKQTHMVMVNVHVTSKTMAVVAKVAIQRGDIINAEHVELAPVASRVVVDDLVYEVDLVVGSEAKNMIRAGQHVTSSGVRKPILVRRGDTVEMIAQSGGVRVRRFGRALQDGALDSVVGVESLDRERQFNARVSGYQAVSVLGNAGRAPTVNR